MSNKPSAVEITQAIWDLNNELIEQTQHAKEMEEKYVTIKAEYLTLIANYESLRLRFANSEWLPIETAPKDGSHILLFWPQTNEYPTGDGYRIEGARWYSKEECVGPTRYWEPAFVSISHTAHHFCGMTHWMPLPKPPTA